MRVKDVFTPGRYPTVTFINDHLADKQVILRDAIETGSMVLSLSGPSKSGKTVFVENIIGKDNLLHVTGAGIASPETLWNRIFNIIGTPIPFSQSEEANQSISMTGKTGCSVGIKPILSGNIEGGLAGNLGLKTTTTQTFTVDYLQLLIHEIKDTDFVVFIDDFHYIPKDVQENIAKEIKEAIRNDVKIICAAVPYHSDDVLRSNPDLRGRIVKIDFNYWNHEILSKIATKGFESLNIFYSPKYISSIAREAAGSPQLMQALCLNTCFELGLSEHSPIPVHIPADETFFNKVCTRTSLMTDYSSIIEKLKDGPKTRGTERIRYTLKNGANCDVYPLILQAMALDPPELTFRYQNLQERISKICSSSLPSGSSVTGACYHISDIANASAGQVIIEWDGENDVLDLRDPYLLFYLRWSAFQN